MRAKRAMISSMQALSARPTRTPYAPSLRVRPTRTPYAYGSRPALTPYTHALLRLRPMLTPYAQALSALNKIILNWKLNFLWFISGANQLLWYYADLEKHRCYDQHNGVEKEAPLLPGNISVANVTGNQNTVPIDINHCLAWRRFANLWETSQTLFWAIFGLIDLDNFELTGIREFTRFIGLLMFGSFSVINVIVLLNLLIAMMNHSYQLISVSSVSQFAFRLTWGSGVF